MEQGKQAKRLVSVRLSETGYQHIVERADRADVDVSHMIRRMLAYAAANMPEGWVPPSRKR